MDLFYNNHIMRIFHISFNIVLFMTSVIEKIFLSIQYFKIWVGKYKKKLRTKYYWFSALNIYTKATLSLDIIKYIYFGCIGISKEG